MRPLLLALAVALAGCGAEPVVPDRPICPPLKQYAPDFSEAVASRIEALPDGDVLVTITRDLMVLRAQCRPAE